MDSGVPKHQEESADRFFRNQNEQAMREKIQAVDDALDKEMGRWQDAIKDLLDKNLPDPDDDVDGSGCDSGDPLDLSLSEISQALSRWQDKLHESIDVSHLSPEQVQRAQNFINALTPTEGESDV